MYVALLAFITTNLNASDESPLDLANRGAQLYGQARYAEAEALYRAALAAWPADVIMARGRVIILNNLGEVLRTTGRYAEAEHVADRALELAESLGNQAAADAGIALDNLSVIYRTRGDPARAEAYALRAAPLVNDRERPVNLPPRRSLRSIG